MLRSTIGVHRASPRHRASTRTATRARLILGIAISTSVIGSLAVAPSVGAATFTPRLGTESTVGLTTVTVDKPWYTVERFYLGLLNCTRTGGWVLSDGTCRGYGSGRYSKYVTPIRYTYGVSDKVSRPYAKLLAARNLCSHTANGDPGYRLRRVGYTSWTWGENIGCRDGYASAKAAVLASHLKFQAERSTNGGHWRNIKNAKYKCVGIGIWRYGSRTRLVTDFYG
ncbi:MAG: CAP domain-containing protein [Chloroflexi bacterium]|nr:CAP domain-containing protein [Chloroflexota bacterium]